MTKAFRTYLIAQFLQEQRQFDGWSYEQLWQQAVLLEQTSVPNWLKRELKKGDVHYSRLFHFLHGLPLTTLMGV